MALKIIGAGFARTGTMSTFTALNLLGFPCYHMVEVLDNPANKNHLDFWRKVANAPAGIQHDWNEVFANYTATLDNPAACVWRELAVAYPDAKILLTLHPKGAEAWYDSTIETIYFTENSWLFRVLEWFTPFGRKFADMTRKLVWQRAHKGTMADRASATAFYHQHIEEVRRAIPAERLLLFSADQGWQPLCEFLGVPEPEGDFPNVNDRTAKKQAVAAMISNAYRLIAAIVIAVALAIGLIAYVAFALTR